MGRSRRSLIREHVLADITREESSALTDKMKRRMDAEEGRREGGREAGALMPARAARARSLMSCWRQRANENSNFGLLFLSLSPSLSLSLPLPPLNGVLILFPPSTPLNRERTTNEARGRARRGASPLSLSALACSLCSVCRGQQPLHWACFLRCVVEPVQIKLRSTRFGRLFRETKRGR